MTRKKVSITLTNLSQTDTALLTELLLSSPSKKIWYPNETYSLSSQEIDLELSHHIIWRERKEGKTGGIRYEVFSLQDLFKTTNQAANSLNPNSKIYNIAGTLALDDGQLQFKTDHERLIKIKPVIEKEDLAENNYTFAKKVGYLGVKKTTRIDNMNYVVMKKIRSKTLRSIIQQDQNPHSDSILTLLARLTLTERLLQALKNIEEKEFIHFDLNLDNILVDEESKFVYFIDFEFSRVNETQNQPSLLLPAFSAPEVYHDKITQFTTKTDVYSMGVVLAILWGVLETNIYKNTVPCRPNFSELFQHLLDLPNWMKNKIKSLLEAMTAETVNNRITLDEAIKEFHTIQRRFLCTTTNSISHSTDGFFKKRPRQSDENYDDLKDKKARPTYTLVTLSNNKG